MPGCHEAIEDRGHALVLCGGNDDVGQRMMRCLRNYMPNIEVGAALRLEISVEEDLEFPLVWLMASVFLSVWKLRVDKSGIQLNKVRALLEANINLLRETRFSNKAVLLDQLVASYF